MKDFLLFIGKILLACLAYFADVKNLFHAVLLFMAIDWITGVYASYKLREKGKSWFTSYKMRRTIEKFVFYMMAIAVSYVFRIEFLETIPLGKIVAGYIAITEIKSIFENIGRIMGVQIFNEIYQIIKDKFFGHYQVNDPRNSNNQPPSNNNQPPTTNP
jgi:phage-related holin